MRKSVTSPLNGFYLMKYTCVIGASPPEPGKVKKSRDHGKGQVWRNKAWGCCCVSFPPRVVRSRILCELQAARIRGVSKLTVLQHLQPRLLGLVRSAVNALRTFGNLILLCAQERKRQGKNSGDYSTQALSIQGVRRVYSFVLASPWPPILVQHGSWLSWRIELEASTTAYLCSLSYHSSGIPLRDELAALWLRGFSTKRMLRI